MKRLGRGDPIEREQHEQRARVRFGALDPTTVTLAVLSVCRVTLSPNQPDLRDVIIRATQVRTQLAEAHPRRKAQDTYPIGRRRALLLRVPVSLSRPYDRLVLGPAVCIVITPALELSVQVDLAHQVFDARVASREPDRLRRGKVPSVSRPPAPRRSVYSYRVHRRTIPRGPEANKEAQRAKPRSIFFVFQTRFRSPSSSSSSGATSPGRTRPSKDA